MPQSGDMRELETERQTGRKQGGGSEDANTQKDTTKQRRDFGS